MENNHYFVTVRKGMRRRVRPGGCHFEGRRSPPVWFAITYLKRLDGFNRCNPGNASFVSLDKGEAFWQQAHD